MTIAILMLAAFSAATLGAISGLGGGIFLIPILIQVIGHQHAHASLAALSLSVVLLNALTSLFWGQQIRNVDFSFAKPMAVLSAFGAALGVYLQSLVSRDLFELYLAIFLFLLGAFVFWKSSAADAGVVAKPEPFQKIDGGFSVFIGVVASFFGIGGGILQVPYMVYFRKRAVKQATATSQVILSTVAAFSIFMYLVVRGVTMPWDVFAYLAPVVVAGGLLGSRLSAKMRGKLIVRILATAMLILAVRLAYRVLFPS